MKRYSISLQTPILIVLTVVITGCAQVSTPPVMAISSPSVTETLISTPLEPSITPLSTVFATETNSVSPIVSSTPTVTGKPSIPPEAQLQIECLEILPTQPSDWESDGILILDKGETAGDSFMLDLSSGKQTKIGEANAKQRFLTVSPNGQWLAYEQIVRNEDNTETIKDEIVILASDGQPNQVIPWEKELGIIHTWLDNQRLVTIPLGQDEDDSDGSNPTFLVWNPFTDEREFLYTDFPGIYDNPGVPAFASWGSTVFDPTLQRVIYMQADLGFTGPANYILWDLAPRQELAGLKIIKDLNATPHWKTDGESLALAQNFLPEQADNDNSIRKFLQDVWPAYEIYLVTKNGNIGQLTNLTSYYSRVYIDDLSWSPDGKYIAFWYAYWFDPGNIGMGEKQLAVVEVSTGEVTNYCISGGRVSLGGARLSQPPLWSLDSRQIIVNAKYEEKPAVLLLDLDNETIYQISEELRAAGWMSTPH